MPTVLLTIDQVADRLQTTPGHVRKLWARRDLGAIKVGRLVRFSEKDLDAYLEARRTPAAR